MNFVRTTWSLSAFVALACCLSSASAEVRLTPTSIVKFASAEEGRKLLGAADSFVECMTALDRELRLKSEDPVTQEQYLTHAASQVVEWSEEEIAELTNTIESVSSKLAWISIPLPRDILLVRTTDKLEGGAAHTRGKAIIFPRGSIDGPAQLAQHVFLHELFHLIVKENPQMRDSLYKIVGFQTIDELDLPAALQQKTMTNPDAPKLDVVIEVTYRGQTVTAMPILLSKVQRYQRTDDRPFPMGYLDFRFMQIEKTDAGWGPKLVDGKPASMSPTEVSGFFEQIGRNTQYIIHPEEILADNFAFLVMGKNTVPSPEILASLRKLMSQ